MLGLAPADWSRPTACVPWTVAELLAHVLTAVARIPGMLEAPAPAVASSSAVDYYRPDARFSDNTNVERVDLARQRAATTDGHALARELDDAWRRIGRLCAREPLSRTVRTRHGDAMLLTDFLTTRVVELGVHGLDLAAALGRQPWLTPPAADLLTTLLLGTGGTLALRDLGWDAVTFVARATNRRPMTPEEARLLERAGIRRLSLG
jgi:uncharacterized protein (TIGR03083 family)